MEREGQLGLKLAQRRPAALTVSQLVREIRETLDANFFSCWVAGEISNARVAPSSHFYFTLKDDQASINAVMFSSAFRRVRFKPADGMAVMVRGRVSLFEQRGALQLYAEELEPRGAGALQVAFEQLKRALGAEGLFDEARKRPLPFLPSTVGIVTARDGAGLRDMLRIMFDRFPNLRVIVRPARVQGPGAAPEIAQAIADLNRDGRAEVIICGRGGGSLEDLWAFNEEPVARAIFRSKIPIISAVGHEIDFTIADFVADVRAPTPTAAAHMAVPSKAELRERIMSAQTALGTAMRRTLDEARESTDHLAERLRSPVALLRQAREDLAVTAGDLASAIESRLIELRRRLRELTTALRAPDGQLRELRLRASALGAALLKSVVARRQKGAADLARLAAALDSLSPLKVLERGYAVVRKSGDGSVVHDATAVEPGDELDIRLSRGQLRARTIGRQS